LAWPVAKNVGQLINACHQLHLVSSRPDKRYRRAHATAFWFLGRIQAMAEKERFESLTGIEQDVQITERTRHAMETYVNWLRNAMSASPWSNVGLNTKLLGYATDNVTAAVGLVEKLSHAKNLEDVVKIQTEFMSQQLDSFNEQTQTLMEICTKATKEATKRSN
jgi:hypothetical protein